MITFYTFVQRFLALLWKPFHILAKIFLWLNLIVVRAGDLLIRPPYWAILQVKRRKLGQPAWQLHDFQIGIGPPCEHCGEHVPPEKHKKTCAFLHPVAPTIQVQSDMSDIRPDIRVCQSEEDQARILILQNYALALMKNGIDVGQKGTINLKTIIEYVDKDLTKFAKAFGIQIG